MCAGRECEGIHFAVNYLETWQKKQSGRTDVNELIMSAKDKRVVVIGGGDTGVDCIATAIRQARSSGSSSGAGVGVVIVLFKITDALIPVRPTIPGKS